MAEHLRVGVWLVAVLVLGLAGCVQERSPGSQPPGETAPPTARAADSSAQPSACATAGHLGAGQAPVADLSESCSILRGALEGRTVDGERILKIVKCGAPVEASEPSASLRAAAVAADLEVDGPPSHAAFLLVNHGQGWCPADQILDISWTHGGYCEAAFRLAWTPPDASRSAGLDVVAQRTCHRPLDQAEVRAGESDEAFSECLRIKYRDNPSERTLTRSSQEEIDGECPVR